MTYSHEVERMCPLTKGPNHGPAPIPEEGNWVKAYEIKDISGYTHGVGWCAPQQGTCKLTLNVKNGVIEEALVETIGCSGMTHSAAMAGEILPGKTILEALNTDLVCDAINVAMRELFLQIVYGRSQTAFSEDGLPIGAGLEDLGKGLRSQVGTMFSTSAKGVRYLEMAEGYITQAWLWMRTTRSSATSSCTLGKMMEAIRHGVDPEEGLREEHRHLRPVRRAPPSTSTPVKNKRGGRKQWLSLKVIERRMRQDQGVPEELRHRESLDAAARCCLRKGHRLRQDRARACSPSAFENAVWAYTLGAAIAVKKGLHRRRRLPPPPSARACRPSACPARWPSSARWAWATATWAPCCCARRPSASPSWPATSPSPPPRAPSASPAPPTRPARSPCASS